MPKHITETTKLKCQFGAKTTPLSVTSQTFMHIEGKLQATEEDKKPNVNIKPFGVCSITKISCSPATQKWQNTSVFEIDGKKELLDTSTCNCSVGGKISVVKSAQNFLEEGGSTIYQPIVYERNEKEEEKMIDEVIKDIYINKIDASVFINYGKKDGDIRMITKGEWYSGNEMPDGEKNKYLIENSKIVTVDDEQIQEKLQEIHSKTKNTEHQIFIVLDKDSAKIIGILGPEGTDGHAPVQPFYLTKKEDGKEIKVSDYLVNDGDGKKRYAFLGEVHTHNLIKKYSVSASSSTSLGGEKIENDFGTSDDDLSVAQNFQIPIYAIDSWNFGERGQATIGRVLPTGKRDVSIGTTKGGRDQEHKKKINIGLDCLNYKVGRKM